jgi:hypothetical protein
MIMIVDMSVRLGMIVHQSSFTEWAVRNWQWRAQKGRALTPKSLSASLRKPVSSWNFLAGWNPAQSRTLMG